MALSFVSWLLSVRISLISVISGKVFNFGNYPILAIIQFPPAHLFLAPASNPLLLYALFNNASMKIVSKQRDLFPGALEMMILQTLKRKPMHGYALAQHIKQISNDLLHVEEGSLYPALQRMLKQGWVKAEWGLSSTNRRIRIYQLTPAGRKHVQQEVSSFERMLEGITRVLSPAKS